MDPTDKPVSAVRSTVLIKDFRCLKDAFVVGNRICVTASRVLLPIYVLPRKKGTIRSQIRSTRHREEASQQSPRSC